jgi:hypothetical protein
MGQRQRSKATSRWDIFYLKGVMNLALWSTKQEALLNKNSAVRFCSAGETPETHDCRKDDATANRYQGPTLKFFSSNRVRQWRVEVFHEEHHGLRWLGAECLFGHKRADSIVAQFRSPKPQACHARPNLPQRLAPPLFLLPRHRSQLALHPRAKPSLDLP